MREPRPWNVALAFVGLVVVLLGLGFGLSKVPLSGGPLAYSAESGVRNCLPQNEYPRVAMGIELWVAKGHTIEIQRIVPVDDSGLTVHGFSAMEIKPNLHVMAEAYPPAEFARQWAARTPAIGRTFSADSGREVIADITATRSGTTGSIKAFDVYYSSGGQDYVATTNIELTLKASSCT